MVKQIVGGTLADKAVETRVNFSTDKPASDYAEIYKKDGLSGGHIIVLDSGGSAAYNKSVKQAFSALKAFPGGMQFGGGVNEKNAKQFLDAGASHIIVTSYIFKDGAINYKNLENLATAVGRDKIVLDLSCKKREDGYYITTDKWEKFTKVKITFDNLNFFADYCDELLIHAIDAEGKREGIEVPLVQLLSKWSGAAITYAGGVGSYEDLHLLKKESMDKLDVTVGSALDLFGGDLSYQEIIKICNESVE